MQEALHDILDLEELITDDLYAVEPRLRSRRAADFDRWLADMGVGLAELADAHITRYHQDRSRPGCTGRVKNWRNELRALRHLLHFLRSRGLCSVVPVETLPADEVVAAFDRYLQCERGLAAGTIGYYRSFSRQFLAERFGKGPVDLGALRATDVVDFVQRQAARMAPRALKLVITALRAFLRYAQYRGEAGPHLVAAVPAVASWSTTPSLPRAIAPEDARRAIESCNPHTAVGRRDRAVLLLLARLGLRSGEIRALMLDDLDWDAGGLRVRGKGRRECLLPLPDEVGQAIAAASIDSRARL
jgi:site-specific recombinase XerD